MPSKVTRRDWVAALACAAAAAAPAQDTKPAAPTPQDELEAARQRLSRDAAQLAKPELPMATEPAFVFKP